MSAPGGPAEKKQAAPEAQTGGAAWFDDWKVTPEHRKQVCDQARADVLKDLRSPMFRKNLWKRARFYQRILEHAIYPNGTPEARGVSDCEREAA